MGLPTISGYPGTNDVAVFNDLLLPYTVSLGAATTCTQIISNTLLTTGVSIDTKGYALTVTADLAIGSNPLLSLGGVLTFLGSGAVTINKEVDLGSTLVLVGVLNCGSATDNTTNVTIQNANVTLNGPNVLATLTLLGGPSAVVNYGKLTMTSDITNMAVESLIVNNGSGNVTTTGSTFNLNNDLAAIVNLGTFNVGGATTTTTNFNLSAGSNAVYNYGTFNVGASSCISNFNLSGGKSTLLSVGLGLNLGSVLGIGVSLTILYGNGPAINNYNLFNAGTTSSACNINLTGTNPSVNNTAATVGSTTYTGAFDLSSVSAIFPTATSALVANNSPNCVFTLLSDANGSATISRVTSGATCTGKFNVQRFLTGGNVASNRGYRLLSSPVNISSATSSASGTNYIALNTINSSYTVAGTTYPGAFTGGSGSGFSVVNPNPTIYFYKEYLPTSNTTYISGKNQGVTSIIGTQVKLIDGITYNIPVGNGYLFYFIGSTASRTTGTTSINPDNAYITNVGYINQQNIYFNLWYTPTGGTLKLADASTTTFVGFNMVGNPYPSTIDLKTVYADNNGTNGIKSSFYELLDGINQSYVSYNASTGGTSGTGASEYVASGQGFFVVANNANSALTFKETEKPATIISPSPIVLALKSTLPARDNSATVSDDATAPIASLHLKMLKDDNTYTECGIYYSSAWSDNYDQFDALYLPAGSASVMMYSLTADGQPVGINSLGSYVNGKNVRIYVKAATDGVYNMQLEDFKNIDTANYHVFLRDNFAKDSTDLVKNKSYAFTITNSDTSSYGSTRFVLAIEKKFTPIYQLLSFTAQKTSGGVLLTWKASNEGNNTHFAIQKQAGGDPQFNSIFNVQSNGNGSYTYIDHTPFVGDNVYRLEQTDVSSKVTYSNAIDIIFSPLSSSGLLSVYPNPARELITVNFSSSTNSVAPQENFQTNIYDATGALILKQMVNGNSWTQNVSTLKPGAYIIEVRADNGSFLGNSKFLKYQ